MAETNITSTSGGQFDSSLNYMSAASWRRELARRHAVNTAMLIYIAIIFEGVVRKYILPDFQRPLIFMRDPIVLYFYAHALRHAFIKKSIFLTFGAVLFFLGIAVAAIQSLEGLDPFFLMMFGLRQYFLLIPLPFVIASVFSYADFQRFYRINMAILVLMAPLMVLQVLSPPDSWLNAGRGLDEALAFGNNGFGDFVRAPGFFTSAVGMNLLLPLDAAILLLVLMMPRRERPCSPLLYVAAVLALLVAVSVSGNRGAIVGLIIVAAAACVLPLLMRAKPAAIRIAVATPLLVIAAFAVFTHFFPEQFTALQERWAGANVGVGEFQIVDRGVGALTDFLSVISRTPPFGFGIGIASNAGVILSGNSLAWDFLPTQVENDWARHIVDLGPIVGILYIVFRIALTARLGSIGIARALRGDATAWLLFAAVGPNILNGLITAQSTVNGLTWFFVGLVLAASRHLRLPKERSGSKPSR